MRISSFFLLCTIVLFACTHEPQMPVVVGKDHQFPKAVGDIFINRCATAGCHNAQSYTNAGGLRLDSWQALFGGGNNGAVVVPYSQGFSSLLYFINTFSELGPIAQPTMPLFNQALTRAEYQMIADWVKMGAPNQNGQIAFATDSQNRQKIYLSQQGCDLVAVIDAASRVVMRYIPVGMSPAIESPHCVRVASDGLYAYVSYLGGTFIQKIDTRRDTVVASLDVGVGSWNVFTLSPNGRQMMLSDWTGNGRMLLINTESMAIEQVYPGLVYPHGVASNADFSMFYVTAQYGNIVYKFSADGSVFQQISIDGGAPSTLQGLRDPHEIMMVPDRSRYFLTCEASNEVRVMDATADTLVRVIAVGRVPQEMAISQTRPLIFVTCMEDQSSLANYKGSVYAINYETYETIRIDGTFYQPHAITVDDRNNTFYVISRNANPAGPAPHHSSSCAGRNGYYQVYDLNTLQPLPKRYEVTVEPYSADVRFKN